MRKVYAKNLLNQNPNLVVTHADKSKSTIVLDKKKFLSKMMKNLDDRTTYARLDIYLTSYFTGTIKNKITNLNYKWKNGGYIDHNFYVKETNLPRAYGSIKLNKQDKAARMIIPCIDTPLADISDFYKDILTAACPQP